MTFRTLCLLFGSMGVLFAQDLGKNLISDGDFETDRLGSGWEIKTDSPLAKPFQPTLEIDSAGAKSGNSCLKITVPPQETEMTGKTFTLWWRTSFKTPLQQGTVFQVKGSLKLQNSVPPINSAAYLGLSLLIGYSDETKKWEAAPQSKFSPTVTNWQTVEFTWKAPKGVKQLTLCLVLPFDVQTAWLDDVSIVPEAP